MKILLERFRVFLLMSLFGLAFSCGPSEPVKEDVVLQQSDEAEIVEYFNKLDLALVQKPSWKKHWSVLVGDFDASDFTFVVTDSIDPMEMPERNPILPSDPLAPYQLPHPDGDGTMDIYSYKVEISENIDRPFLNPDSEVVWFRADGMKERLLFMGPSGMFEEGLWLSADEFLVLGYFQEEAGFRPIAWVIDLTHHRFFQFQLDKVAKDYLPESYLNQKIKQVDLKSNGI
jgi:hypothetical protein